jgi:hypothetical protein
MHTSGELDDPSFRGSGQPVKDDDWYTWKQPEQLTLRRIGHPRVECLGDSRGLKPLR